MSTGRGTPLPSVGGRGVPAAPFHLVSIMMNKIRFERLLCASCLAYSLWSCSADQRKRPPARLRVVWVPRSADELLARLEAGDLHESARLDGKRELTAGPN